MQEARRDRSGSTSMQEAQCTFAATRGVLTLFITAPPHAYAHSAMWAGSDSVWKECPPTSPTPPWSQTTNSSTHQATPGGIKHLTS
eukprot:361808-Chlamydomonas_euryale.AAC.23